MEAALGRAADDPGDARRGGKPLGGGALTGLDSEESGLEALRRGASDYLVKGKCNADMLMRTIRYALERKRLERQLVMQATRDALTGALNRRAFKDLVERMIGRARPRQRVRPGWWAGLVFARRSAHNRPRAC